MGVDSINTGQLVWVEPFQVTMYVMLMAMLVWDDVVLMMWLWSNVQKKRAQLTGSSAEAGFEGEGTRKREKKGERAL